MYSLRRPTRAILERFLRAQRDLPFTYPEVGATRTTPPRGYTVDHHRVMLGHGAECYARAVAAVRRWQMFALGWVLIFPQETPIEVGKTVAVVAHHFGFWSAHASRVVYVLDESAPLRRFGFAYGTLPAHAERGEERFSVEWHADDSVWYDVLAFSQPRLLARLTYPFTRALQKRFARDSLRAMQRAVNSAASLA